MKIALEIDHGSLICEGNEMELLIVGELVVGRGGLSVHGRKIVLSAWGRSSLYAVGAMSVRRMPEHALLDRGILPFLMSHPVFSWF